MKSCITTLAVAVFALTLPAQLCRAEDSAGGQNLAPVVRADPLADPTLAGHPAPAVQYAAMPAVVPTAPVGMPVTPISYAYGGVPGVGHAAQKSGKGGCACPQCRRSRGFGGSWGSVEFMHLWMKGRDVPPLATTSPFPGTPVTAAGVMPTQVLFGNGRIGNDRQSAGRVDFGLWLDETETHGVGVKFFAIEGDKTNFIRSSTGTPILGVPFFNVDLNANDAVVVAYPGIFEGSINHHTSNDLLMGEGYARIRMGQGFGYRMDLVGGYHVIRLDDGLGLSTSQEVLANGQGFPIGTTVDIYDTFKARNEMHGASLGMITELDQGCWSLKSLFKVTVANTHQTVTIAGQTVVDQGLGPVTVPNAGTFAQASNIGTYERDRMTAIPELGFTLGYSLNDCVKLTGGYTAIYFPNVVLAGDHVDTRVSPSQVNAFPAFTWQETDHWAQAITMGLEWNY